MLSGLAACVLTPPGTSAGDPGRWLAEKMLRERSCYRWIHFLWSRETLHISIASLLIMLRQQQKTTKTVTLLSWSHPPTLTPTDTPTLSDTRISLSLSLFHLVSWTLFTPTSAICSCVCFIDGLEKLNFKREKYIIGFLLWSTEENCWSIFEQRSFRTINRTRPDTKCLSCYHQGRWLCLVKSFDVHSTSLNTGAQQPTWHICGAEESEATSGGTGYTKNWLWLLLL